MNTFPPSSSARPAARSLLCRIDMLQPGEGRALLLVGAHFFFLLLGLYLLRQVREAMGIARGADKFPWRKTDIMIAMLSVYPLHAAIVSQFPRRRCMPWISHFFASHW